MCYLVAAIREFEGRTERFLRLCQSQAEEQSTLAGLTADNWEADSFLVDADYDECKAAVNSARDVLRIEGA